MRKRRLLVGIAALFLVGAATSLALAMRPSGGATPGGPASIGSVRVGRLTLPVPRGFNQYDIRGGIHKTGTRPSIIGHVLTNYRVSAHSPIYNGTLPESQPANGVALELQLWYAIGPFEPTRLHLPLSLHEQWAEQSFPGGTRRWGFLAQGKPGEIPYELVVWIGRDALPADRTALLHALASVRTAH